MKNDTIFQYGKSFDYLLTIPLIMYLFIIGGLIIGNFLPITGKAIQEAFQEPAFIQSIRLSMLSSIISTFFAVLIAIPAGYILSRHRFIGYFLIDTIIDMPIVLPPLVMGLCILVFFNTSIGRFLDRGIVKEGLFIYQPLGIILVQFITGCALVIRVMKAGFDSLDIRYEEVAMTLGANRWQTFFKVVLPNIKSSIISGIVISWARIFGLFGPILLVCGTMRGKTEIMPTTIFLETSIGRIEVALVIGGCMILISIITLIIFKKLGGKVLW